MSDVWLGDLIQAWHALGADGERARQVAALMGFELPAVRAETPARGQARTAAPPPRPRPAEPAEGTGRGPASAPVPRPASSRRDAPEPARQVTYRRHLRPSGVDVGVRASPGADQPDDAGTLPAEPARRPAGQAAPLPLPLLSARVTPGIVTAAVATDAGDGPPDVEALTERVAQRRFGEAIPRRVRASLFRGVQLLLDRSPAMAPFERDVTELARLVRLVVGHDVEEVSFAGRPQDVLPGDGPRYAPPRPGTPVLALSDVGIGRAPGQLRLDTRASWPRLAEELRHQGSELVVFVPYPRSRWPALGDGVRLIPWDTTTSPADVTRAVGRILGGRRGRA